MTITEYSIKNKTVIIALAVMVALAGILSFFKLGKLENPVFTIKQAVVVCQYPGASAEEVEKELTNTLETAIQQMKQLDRIWSISRPGYCIIYAEMKDQYDKKTLPQVWDELRRKMRDVQSELPAGASEPVVNDDFGDVYGVYFALSGDGYTMRELYEHAKMLRRELLRCQNVAKITLWGYTPEVIYCEILREKMSQLGISPDSIVAAINAQNTIGDGGRVRYDGKYVRIPTSGSFASIKDIGELIIRGSDPDKLFRLKDIVTLRRGYYEPASAIMEFNGKPAIGIGISTIPGTNVITMGDAVQKRLTALKPETPPGMELGVISYESETVINATNNFIINLIESVIIVVVLLLIFMGFHEGLIIGTILVVTVLATFTLMYWLDITMERVSLGALIIAMGMLVDNAIVVAEGIVVKMQRKVPCDLASSQAVDETKWPLLGATVIAILAFGSISMSQDAAGELLSSLFQVLAISLLLSWIFAITLAPIMCHSLITNKEAKDKDPHDHSFFRVYARGLRWCLKYRWGVVGVMLILMASAYMLFGHVRQNFFTKSDRNQFLLDCWMPEGAHIEQTRKVMREISRELRDEPHVKNVATVVGQGTLRFTLVYLPEIMNSSYGQLLVEVDDNTIITPLIEKLDFSLNKRYPEAIFNIKKFDLGPPTNSSIEARFHGHDPAVLHRLAEQAKKIMQHVKDQTGILKCIRDDWRQPALTLGNDISEARMRNAGLSRPEVQNAIALNYEGKTVGAYRERDELLPLIVRSPEKQRGSIDDLKNLMIWSSLYQKAIPISQVVDGITLKWEDQTRNRRSRQLCISAQCEPVSEEVTADDLLKVLRPPIEAIELPEGYELDWGGEHYYSVKARTTLLKNVPAFFMLMVVVVLFLFGTLRHPVMIFLGLPLALIGVSWGLFIFDKPFGFMALLGFLSLSGMLIKNEIVLLDQIIQENRNGRPPFESIVEASISRVRPVCMAAFTTVLGMIPLVTDQMFGAMAVTIMCGLTFATALTLIVMPVMYAIFFGIKEVPDN